MGPLFFEPEKSSEHEHQHELHHRLEPVLPPLETETREPVHFHSRKQKSRDSFDFSDGVEDAHDDFYGHSQ